MGDSCAEEVRENLEETLDVKVKMGWWSNGFKEGAHAHITARSISIAAQIQSGYEYHVSSQLLINDCQIKYVLMIPAMVTMKPRPRRMQTPVRCFAGILSFQTRGMGSKVHSKSAMQLKIPMVSVEVPSSMHL